MKILLGRCSAPGESNECCAFCRGQRPTIEQPANAPKEGPRTSFIGLVCCSRTASDQTFPVTVIGNLCCNFARCCIILFKTRGADGGTGHADRDQSIPARVGFKPSRILDIGPEDIGNALTILILAEPPIADNDV